MLISEAWLREYIDPDLDTLDLAHQMTMAGLEVEAVNVLSGDFENVVVAEIVSVGPHPDSKKLNICKVDAGDEEPVLIVCGAPNATAGLRVPFARVGASLPGGISIKAVEIRGVSSAGMLCAEKELGISDADEGLMELSPEAPLGEDLKTYLDLEDNLFELGLTPNRSDCLSVRGIAREVAALNGMVVNETDAPHITSIHSDKFPVRLDASGFCPIYLGRIIHNVDLTRAVPAWMGERLRRSGIRSINAAVDITNYVMLELGQPMHAFDFAKLRGSIVVRNARADEELVLLNDSKIVLSADTTVIADEKGVLALAGIMGGKTSAVTEDTTSIFLEAAFFVPEKISGWARKYGLHTDSSHRFERGVDIAIQRRAIDRATELLLQLAGGQAGDITEIRDTSKIFYRQNIQLNQASINEMLGLKIPIEQVESMLTSLGIQLTPNKLGWKCVIPSWRFDLVEEADLLEEIARIFGYNNLPITPIKSELVGSIFPESRLSIRRIRKQLTALGYNEAITYSFQGAGLQHSFDPDISPIRLMNPISEDLSVMRTSLVPGLLQALIHNLNRQRQRVCLFETGLTFLEGGTEINQQADLGMVFSGTNEIENWANESRTADFFDIKGDLEEIFSLTGSLSEFSFIEDMRDGFHPGQTARIYRSDEAVGWVGAIHPELASGLGVEIPIFAAEIHLDAILRSKLPQFEEVSKYPEIRRDIALLIDNVVTAEQVMSLVRSVAGDKLIDLTLFDIYSGEGIDSKRKSVAIGLTFCDRSSTLKDADVATAVGAVIESLKKEFAADLR